MDNTYVSKDNGLTWTKRVGNSLTRSVYGGKFVDVGTSLSLITKRNQRTDGSSISPDVITIGQEGATTVIDNLVARNVNATTVNVSSIGYGTSNTLSIAGNVNVSMGSPTTEISFVTTTVTGAFSRIAFGGGIFVQYGYLGKLYYSTNGINWTLGTYPTIEYGARVLLYTGDRFLFFSEGGSTGMLTSMNGITWNNTGYITTAPYGNINLGAAGNNVAILSQFSTGNISVSTNNTGVTWTNISLAGTIIYQVGFGKMSFGTNPNVFLLVGPNVIKRADKAVPNAPGDWLNPTNTPLGNWWYIGFGNDTFMVTSNETPGKLSISTNGGLAWSTPIDFGIRLRQPVYFEGDWFIGSDSGFMMLSKNNGLTWEKKTGGDIETFASGNNLLVGINDVGGEANNKTRVVLIKKKRDDGSLITSDTIRIGSKGAMTVVNDEINVTGSIGLNKPITIGYTIPILNTQLGYFTRSFSTDSFSVVSNVNGASFGPIGPLVPGLYLATFTARTTASSLNPYYRLFELISRTTPFTHNAVVTGEVKYFPSSGLYLSGHVTASWSAGDPVNHSMSGLINITENDTLNGTIVSYFAINSGGFPTCNSYNFSVVRVG